MHVPEWMLSAGATAITLVVAPLIKDVCTEWWKARSGQVDKQKMETAIVKVAQIEAEQGRETRVNSEVWRLIDELKGEVEDVRNRLQTSEARNAELSDEIEHLQARLKQFETLSKENTALRNKVRKLQTALAQAQAELQGRQIAERKA